MHLIFSSHICLHLFFLFSKLKGKFEMYWKFKNIIGSYIINIDIFLYSRLDSP
jgi:hypothetical protein